MAAAGEEGAGEEGAALRFRLKDDKFVLVSAQDVKALCKASASGIFRKLVYGGGGFAPRIVGPNVDCLEDFSQLQFLNLLHAIRHGELASTCTFGRLQEIAVFGDWGAATLRARDKQLAREAAEFDESAARDAEQASMNAQFPSQDAAERYDWVLLYFLGEAVCAKEEWAAFSKEGWTVLAAVKDDWKIVHARRAKNPSAPPRKRTRDGECL